ncbi:MAG: AtpZ/AtpI family protein [Anaerolineae bacterium]|nr:AtpZ/AtpI family protein [Anaerolineae bacterium]
MKNIKWGDLFWALSMGARGGLVIVMPVLLGLAVGFVLDKRFGTLPFISLALTAVGAIIGPIVLYRWVVRAVAQRTGREDTEHNGERA